MGNLVTKRPNEPHVKLLPESDVWLNAVSAGMGGGRKNSKKLLVDQALREFRERHPELDELAHAQMQTWQKGGVR